MFAIRCIPLATGAPPQELSYFSKEQIADGSIIKIQLRGKDSFGLVLSSEPISDLKQTLRTSSFTLKKLTSPQPRAILSRTFLRACFEAAMEDGCSPGSLIAALTPTEVLLKRAAFAEAGPEVDQPGISYEPLLFSHTHSERIAEYRRMAREALARGKSIVIVTPTVAEAERIASDLMHGIRGYVAVLHGSLTKKKQVENWKHAVESAHPVVLVGTLFALSIPRNDISTIVLEREGTQNYNRDMRPYFRGAVVAEHIAKQLGARFIIASTTPSVISAYRRIKGDVHDLGLSSVRIQGPNPVLIDLKLHKKGKGGYEPLTQQTCQHIELLLNEKKKVLIVTARKGLAPLTVCDDCGDVLRCLRCKSTLVLHKKERNEFICHHCNQTESATVRCRHCGGWRLTTLGIAIDRIYEFLSEKYPDTPIQVIGGENSENKAEAKSTEAWSLKGGIMLATERVLPYLPDEIPGVVVASVDSFLSIPEYTASERVFTLLSELKTRASELFLIQTREPQHRAIRAIAESMSTSYFRDELKDREQFNYPPFATLIRFTLTGSAPQLEIQKNELLQALEQFTPTEIPARISAKGQSRVHILLRLPSTAWVDQRLLRFIRTLPQQIEVRINPTSLHTD